MAFDDLPLHRTPETPGPSRRGSTRSPRSATSRWIILGAGTVIVAVILGALWMARAQPPSTVLAPTSPADAARTSRRPQPDPLQLPPLAESDTMLQELVASLSRNPLLARLLVPRGAVRAATLAVVMIGDGRTPVIPLTPIRPTEKALVTDGKLDPASYARWDPIVRALDSVNPGDAAKVYVNVKPLFDEAYRELGYPDGDFDQALVRAIKMLNATPSLSTEPTLLTRPAYAEHQDAALRALPPVQKQLLLMGPAHRRAVLAWLKVFAETLELKID